MCEIIYNSPFGVYKENAMKKMMKKLLIACITAAVLISCFCVAAGAEVGNGKIADILEYYDAEKTFAVDTFDSAEESGRLSLLQTTATYRDGLAVIEMGKTSRVSYSVNCKDGNVGANFRFRIEGENAGNLRFELAGDSAARLELAFDFAGTKTLTCTPTDAHAEKGTPVTVEGLTLTAGTFYTVSVFYTKATKSVSLSVTDEAGAVATCELTPAGLSSVTAVTLRLPNKNNAGATLSLDYAEVYTGSFVRTFTEKQQKTEEAIVALVDLYNAADTSDADREAVISTIHTLIAAGFTATEGTPAYEALYGGPSLGDKIPYQSFAVTFYTKQLTDAVAKIDTTKSYDERLAFVGEMNAIHTAILAAGVADPDDDSDYAVALATYRAEAAAVEKIRTDAETLIALMANVAPATLNYADSVALIEAAADLTINNTYPGITDAIAVYDQVVALNAGANQKAKAFLAAVADMANAEATFAVRYSGYVGAVTSYYEDETFFLTDEAGVKTYPIADALGLYNEWREYFEGVIEYNERFLSFVSRAVYATERNSRINCILAAEGMMQDDKGTLLVEVDYIRRGTLPGDESFANSVELAMEKVRQMNETLKADKVAIAKYIEAVNKLKNAATILEKKALIDETKALRVSDDLLAIDGVVEANITFSTIEAQVTLWEGYSKIALQCAADLKTASALADRAALILKARTAFAALTDKTYAGVAEAEATVTQAVKDYNSDVALMNEMFERETDAALDVSYAAAPKTIVGVIAWLSKEHY